MANYFDQFEEIKEDNKQKSYWDQFEPMEAEAEVDEFNMDFQDPKKVTLGDNLSKAIATTGQATMSNRPYVPNTSGALEGGVNYINDLASQVGNSINNAKQGVQNAYNTIANKPINLMPSKLMQPVSNAFSGVGRVASDVLPYVMDGYYNSPKDIVEATQQAYNYGVEEAKRDRQKQELNPINLAESLVDMYTIGKFMPGNKATMLGRMGVAGKTGAVYGGLESLKHKGINPKENLKDAAVDAALFATLEPLAEIGFAAAKEGAKRLNPANYQQIIESVPKTSGSGLSQRTVYEPKVKYEYKPNVKNEYGMKEALNKPRIEANKMSDSTAFELGEASELKYGVSRPIKEAPKKTVVDYLAPNIAAKQQAKALEKAEKAESNYEQVMEEARKHTIKTGEQTRVTKNDNGMYEYKVVKPENANADSKIAELERKMKLVGGEKTQLGQKYKRQIEELRGTEQAVAPVSEEVKPVAEETVSAKLSDMLAPKQKKEQKPVKLNYVKQTRDGYALYENQKTKTMYMEKDGQFYDMKFRKVDKEFDIKTAEPKEVKPVEPTEEIQVAETKKEDTTDIDNQSSYVRNGDLEVGKVYKLGKHYIKPKEDVNGNLYFDDNIGVWGGQQYILKTDLKNIERVEKYDKLTDKELKFLSEKEDNLPTNKATKPAATQEVAKKPKNVSKNTKIKVKKYDNILASDDFYSDGNYIVKKSKFTLEGKNTETKNLPNEQANMLWERYVNNPTIELKPTNRTWEGKELKAVEYEYTDKNGDIQKIYLPKQNSDMFKGYDLAVSEYKASRYDDKFDIVLVKDGDEVVGFVSELSGRAKKNIVETPDNFVDIAKQTQEKADKLKQAKEEKAGRPVVKYSVKVDKYNKANGLYMENDVLHTDGNSAFYNKFVMPDKTGVQKVTPFDDGALKTVNKMLETTGNYTTKLEDIGKIAISKNPVRGQKIRVFEADINGKKQQVFLNEKYLLDKKNLELYANDVEPQFNAISIRRNGEQIGLVMPIRVSEYESLVDVPKMKVSNATSAVKPSLKPQSKKTEKVDASYSLDIPKYSKDITKTKEFKKWSGDTPMVSSKEALNYPFKTGQGVTVEGYHGAKRGDRVGAEFKKERATSGPMAFFSSDKDIATSYSKGKEDTSLSDEMMDYWQWFKYRDKDGNLKPLGDAWWDLSFDERRAVAKNAPHISFDDEANNIIFDQANNRGVGNYDYALKQYRNNPLKALIDGWLEGGSLYGREDDFLKVLEKAGVNMDNIDYIDPYTDHSKVYDVYISMKKPLVTNDIPNDLVERLSAEAPNNPAKYKNYSDIWDKNTKEGVEWVNELKKDLEAGENSHVWTSIPDWVTEEIKKQGYDGIIDIGGKGGGEIHKVYIPFEPTQIKSVNNRGTFDVTDPNIYHSIDIPDFMKNSKVVDNGLKDIELEPIFNSIKKGISGAELAKILPKELGDIVMQRASKYKFTEMITKGKELGVNHWKRASIELNLKAIGNSPKKFVNTLMHEVKHAEQYKLYLDIMGKPKNSWTFEERSFIAKYNICKSVNKKRNNFYNRHRDLCDRFEKNNFYSAEERNEAIAKLSKKDQDIIDQNDKNLLEYLKADFEAEARAEGIRYDKDYKTKSGYRNRTLETLSSNNGTKGKWTLGTNSRSGFASVSDTGYRQKAKQSVEQTVRDKVYDWHGGIGKDRYDVDKALNSFIRMSKNIAKDLSQKTGLKVSDKQLREMLPFLRERTNIPEKLDRDDLKKIFNALSGEEKARLVKFADDTSNKFEKYYKNYLDAKGEVDEATIENHISHIWDLDDKKQALLTNYITTKSKFAKQRTIETLAKGINGIEIDGKIVEFKPKTLDYAEILKSSSDNLIKATYDMQLAETIKGMKDAEGKSLVLPAHKAPADWIEVSHPALNKAVYMGTVGEDELPMLMKSSVKVHPDLEKYVASIFETPKTSSKFWKGYDSINGILKQTQLGFSGFHGYALSESALANMGVKKTLDSLNVKKVYDAVKNGNYEIYEHEAEAKRAIDAGVQLGTPSDLNRNLVEETLNKIPVLGKYISGAVSVNNKILWDVLHNNFKLFTFNAKIAELEKAGKVTKEQERAVAQWVNDTYGGQSWELLGVKNSDVRKAGRVLLSPDWNFSTVRQALGSINNTKLDKIFNDTKAWKRVAELMGVSENIGGEGVRGKIARDFWIRAVVYSTIFYNVINAAFRADDREKHPERYPKNMKPFDYSIWANANPMDNWYEKMMPYVFIGRNSDGTARMLRVGKQFREVPELAADPITKLSGKSASIIGLLTQVAVGMSPADIVKKVSGREAYLNQNIWEGYGEDARMRDGIEAVTGRLKVAAKGAAPFMLSKYIDGKHEPSAWDMFAQTSVGSTKGKVYKEAKEAFEAGREDKIREIKQKAYRDGVRKEDINKMVGYAEKNYKADNTKKYRKKFVEAMKNKDKKELNRIKSDMQRHHLSAKEQRRIYESAYKKYLQER